MIFLIGGEKGGTGKSTIATNIAVCLASIGRDVLLLDADRQSTSANWASERSEKESLSKVHCVQRYGNIFKPIQDLAKRYQDIVIDAGGRDSEEMRTSMAIADVMLSPIRASQSDLWTMDHVDQLVGLAKGLNPELKAHVFISMGPTNPRISETNDASKMLSDFEHFEITKTVIRDRKVFRDAMCEGRGVVEMNDLKAINEINLLIKEVIDAEIQQSKEQVVH